MQITQFYTLTEINFIHFSQELPYTSMVFSSFLPSFLSSLKGSLSKDDFELLILLPPSIQVQWLQACATYHTYFYAELGIQLRSLHVLGKNSANWVIYWTLWWYFLNTFLQFLAPVSFLPLGYNYVESETMTILITLVSRCTEY